MKVVLSVEAAQEISGATARYCKDQVPAILYSYRPRQVEQHYHRDSEGVKVSFTESKDNSIDGRWVLGWGWYERDNVSEEAIIRVDGIDLIFTPWNSKPTSKEALITFIDNKFHVTYT